MTSGRSEEETMPDLPRKKVGLVACSGEELPGGTVTRLATLRVLEELRPGDTVTICLPLFLAGGEGDRAFARFYPTIAIDGCEKRCAARATEMHSGKPAVSIVVPDVVAKRGLGSVDGSRRLNPAGMQAVAATAERIAEAVDLLLGSPGGSGETAPSGEPPPPEGAEPMVATCSCGSGIPIQSVLVGKETVSILALPLIFEQFRQAVRSPDEAAGRDLLEKVRVYNSVPAGEEEAYATALLREYAAFLGRKEGPR
jgi:uncharacterized metal-binding protein